MGEFVNKSWIHEIQAAVIELGEHLDFNFSITSNKSVEVCTEDGIRVFTHDGFSFCDYEVSENGDLTVSQGGYDPPRRHSTRRLFSPETVSKARNFIKKKLRSLT